MTQLSPTAALIIIGNEILSGRTHDTNGKYIAEKLTAQGIRLREIRVVPDVKDIIIKTVNELKARETYVFTTGGIGPTHDDITADSIAEAFGVENTLNEDARQMLINYYGSETDLNEGRLKMAKVPVGASLISNPVSGAPGFIMGNVYTMAGVPRICQAMMDNVASMLTTGPKIYSASISCSLGESRIAHDLEEIQSRYAEIEIGSYPHYRANNVGLSIVLRGTDRALLEKSAGEVASMIHKLGGEPGGIEYSG